MYATNKPSLCNTHFKSSDIKPDSCRSKIYNNTNVKIPPNGASTGPNIVWTYQYINMLPNAKDIINRNYTGVSIDIEGVDKTYVKIGIDNVDSLNKYQDDDNDLTQFSIQLIQKLQDYHRNNITTIITLPGWGVKNGGIDVKKDIDGSVMKWFTQQVNVNGKLTSVRQNTDFVCLMFYALINDTVCGVGAGPESEFVKNLEKYWSGSNSKYQLDPSQIILGFSIAGTNDLSKYINDKTLKLASGGITRWGVKGGIRIDNPTKCPIINN